MKIMICGATGLIGQALVNCLHKHHQLTLIGRNLTKINNIFDNMYIAMTWDDLIKGGTESIKNQDVIVNLAGENIAAKRWSKQQKNNIMQSRVSATSLLAKLCAELGMAAPRLLNASAIGIYGLPTTLAEQNNVTFDENSSLPSPTTDFISKVGSAWEEALRIAESNHVNVVKMRFAVVLAKHGGALSKMLPSFKLGLGAVLGSGQQPFSWVALDDVISAIEFLILHPELSGAVNIVAPQIVCQREFAYALANSLNRRCFFHLPNWLITRLFGQMGNELLLNGQRVISKQLASYEFEFEYKTLDEFFLKMHNT